MSAPFLILNQGSPVPPYEQICLQIRTMISLEHLMPGDQLPSVRQLARDLSIAPNTVMRTYTELEREGWVVISARKGVKVAPCPPLITEEERRSRLAPAVTQLLVTAHQLGVSAKELHAEIDRHLARFSKLER
jgi:GntR family transcriptional regulator